MDDYYTITGAAAPVVWLEDTSAPPQPLPFVPDWNAYI